jgi:hypothetical protein
MPTKMIKNPPGIYGTEEQTVPFMGGVYPLTACTLYLALARLLLAHDEVVRRAIKFTAQCRYLKSV